MHINYSVRLDSTYRADTLTQALVLAQLKGNLSQATQGVMSQVKGDDSLSIKEKRDRLLFLTIMGGAGAAMLLRSNDANALFGEEWAAFDAATAPLITGVQTLFKTLGDNVLKQGKKLATDQMESLGKLSEISDSADKEEGSLNRATKISISDAKKADATSEENARIKSGTQSIPTACANDVLLQIALNKAPKAKPLNSKKSTFKIGSLLNPSDTGGGVKATLKELFVKKTRQDNAHDEHIDSSNFRKAGTYSIKEESLASQHLEASVANLSGVLPTPTDSDIYRETGAQGEAYRGLIKSSLSLVADTRTTAFNKRVGSETNFQALKKSVSSLKESQDSRDRAYYNGYERLLDKVENDSDGRISQLESVMLLGEQRNTPEYLEYLSNLGAESSVYLKELSSIKQSHTLVDGMIAEEQERHGLLLAAITQFKLLKKVH